MISDKGKQGTTNCPMPPDKCTRHIPQMIKLTLVNLRYMHNTIQKSRTFHFISFLNLKDDLKLKKCFQKVNICFLKGDSCQINSIYLESNSLVNILMNSLFLGNTKSPGRGKLLHWKDGRSPSLNPIKYKCKLNFTPRNIEIDQCTNSEALKNFACTRLKLQSILRRHEKIESILLDVKQRIAPMQFLLSTAEEKNLLNQSEMMKLDSCSANRLGSCNLCGPHSELKTRCLNKPLRDQLNDIKNLDLLGEASFARVCSEVSQSEQQLCLAKDDWKKMLKDLNEWCMQIDNEEAQQVGSGDEISKNSCD